MTEFPIYILGDADSYYHIFNSIAILMNSDFVKVATSLAVMVLMLRVGVAFSKANVSAGAGGTFMAIGVFAASLYPTTTAHIIDVRQQGNIATYSKIDNLPFALVFIAYGGSSVIASVAPMLDTAFSVIDSNKATEIGLGRQPELLGSLLKTSNLNTQENDFKMTYFKNAFKIYTKDCAMSTSYIPPAGLDYFTKSPKDILKQIHYDELGIPTMAYTNTTFTDGTVTINKCRDLYDYIDTARANIELELFEKLKKANPDIDWNTYSEKISQGIYEAGFRVEEIDSSTGTYSAGLRASMINYALGKTLEDSISNYKYDIPSVANDLANYSVNKSMFSMITDGIGMIAWINKIAPLVIHYSLLFSYGLFLLVIPVAIGMGYPNAMKILGNYAMGIIALHMGYLAAIIANSISIHYTAKASLAQVLSIGNNMTAVSAIPALNQHAAEMAGISGVVLLIMAYTAGTAIIFKGETAALQGAMGTIAGRFRNEMMNAADDMSRKNAYDDAAEQERVRSSKFIKENGFAPAPIGVSEIEYANSLKRGLEEIGSGLGFARANQSGGSGFEGDYLSGASNKSSSMATSTATFGANTTSQQAIDSGIVQGSMEAGAMIGTASLANRANSLMQGAIFSKQRELSATAEYGDRTISDRAIQAGINEGAMNASKTNASATFGPNELAKGTLHQELQKLQSTTTFGANTTSQQAIDSGTVMGTQSAGQAVGMSKALQQEGSDAIKNASQTSSLAQIKDQIQNANTLQSKFGKDLDGKSNSMSYNEMAQAESEMKLAGRVGSASGYRALGTNAFDMTAENADYGVRSKTLATQAGIEGKGGVDNAVATDVANALLKAVSEKLNVDAQKDKGILNSSGTSVTEDGMKALSIKPNQDAQAIMAQKELGEKAGEYLAKLEDKLRKDGLSESEIKDKMAPYKNNDGSYKTGQDFWDTLAAQKAGVFTGHNSLMMGDGTMFSGGFSKDGGITGKLSSGISSTADNSNNTVNGSDDKGMVKRAAENALASLFGEELAREMIGGWNAVGETVLGAGIVGAAYGGYKKFTSNQLDTKPNPANNPTKIPTDAPINSNIDNPNNSMEDSLKRYGNAEAHNASIAQVETNSNSLYKNVAGHLGDIMKATGVGAAIYETAGSMGNVFTAIRDTGQEFYKTGEFNGDRLATAAKQVPITMMNNALDGINTIASAGYAAVASPFSDNSFGQNFNQAFNYNARGYSELSAQAAPSFFDQMQNGLSGISPAASSAIMSGSYTAPAPSTFDTSVATAERHVTETVSAQKEAQVTQNETIDTIEQGFKSLTEALKK